MSSGSERRDAAEHYARWAPDGAPWSPWVKPLIFTELRPGGPAVAGEVEREDTDWAPDPFVEEAADDAGYREAPARRRVPAPDRAAIVVELPARESALVGLALVRRGYRPIPLYNGVSGGRHGSRVHAIAEGMREGTALLEASALPLDAPPAFLLDRGRVDVIPRPGEPDNRWHVFAQDFPSAARLRAGGIARVVVRTPSLETYQEDLLHVLVEWRKGGLPIFASAPGAALAPVEPTEPPRFRSLLRRALVIAGLRRNSAGGFGAIVPIPQQGGGS